jgi:hypothetical protein
VTAQNNVLDLQVDDSVLNNSGGVDVGGGDQVADVTVDEDIAGFEAEKGSFGDSRIGATEPKNRRALSLGEFLKESRISVAFVVCPSLIGLESVGERIFLRTHL